MTIADEANAAADGRGRELRTPTWTPPGPGSWVLDKSHGPSNPTPFYRRIASEHTAEAYRTAMAEAGAAIDTIDMKFVHGKLYRRIVPLVGAKFDRGKTPPKAVLALVSRLHPEFRRRERRMAERLASKEHLKPVREWALTERFEWQDKNRALQSVALDGLADGELGAHIARLDDHIVSGWLRHHRLHVYDLGPIGDLLSHAQKWQMDVAEVMTLLQGSSPATVEAAEHANRIAAALVSADVDPAEITSVDQISAVPDAAAALDAYLDTFGARLIVDYDIEGHTLHELPSAICAIVRTAARQPAGHAEAQDEVRLDRLRSQAGDAELFDDLLDDAKAAYGLRDDNGPLTWAWPAGLMRAAFLEAGGRLAAAGRIDDPAHVFELDSPELVNLLGGGPQPSAHDLAVRADERRWEATIEAPTFLGPVADPNPDLSGLTPALRRGMGIVITATSLLEPDPSLPVTALTGLGIGSETYRGIARVADDPNRAIDELEPGDVLVAAFTAPSYNAVLSIAGGVVVQEGGLLCHAAVMARELDIPAVIGCTEAMTKISSGDLVEIDPAAGTVTVL